MADSTTPQHPLSNVVERVRHIVNQGAPADQTYVQLLGTMIHSHKWLLEANHTMLEPDPTVFTVRNGPFVGMKMRRQISAGSLLPMLFGSYEAELHEEIEKCIALPYKTFVNIGCGDGYYAIGMARRMPNTKVLACDINPQSQVGCRHNAVLNSVSDRVEVMGLFRGEDFARLPPHEALVMVDIESAEDELLDPEKYPNLKKLDIIVELHEVDKPGIAQRIMNRFKATHDMVYIENHPKRPQLPAGQAHLSELDEFMITFEGRGGPTPWGIMKVKR